MQANPPPRKEQVHKAHSFYRQHGRKTSYIGYWEVDLMSAGACVWDMCASSFHLVNSRGYSQKPFPPYPPLFFGLFSLFRLFSSVKWSHDSSSVMVRGWFRVRPIVCGDIRV